MAKAKPTVTVRGIGPRTTPSEDAVRALEHQVEAQQADSAGRAPAGPRARGAWTKQAPYQRKRDGVATRGTTVYLPVALAERLRRVAFATDRRQSDILTDALAAWLRAHDA